jgi:hypothetical protein
MKQKGRESSLDPAVWIPRREAARILSISLNTVLRWEGPRFRITSTRDSGGRIVWFVNAADVERARLQRLGPTMHELESFVLSELARGSSASAIVRSNHHVTLADVERIRDHDARLSGACVIDPATSSELRQLVGAETLNASSLLKHVAALVARVEMLTARLNGATASATAALPSPHEDTAADQRSRDPRRRQ